MPVNPYTNAFMKALPAALRPNPYSIDEYVMEAIQNGWTTDALATACYARDRNPNPAFVVTNVRHLCKYPPTTTTAAAGKPKGHIPCDQHNGCELCRCTGETLHHQPIPMPDWFKERFKDQLGRFGRMP